MWHLCKFMELFKYLWSWLWFLGSECLRASIVLVWGNLLMRKLGSLFVNIFPFILTKCCDNLLDSTYIWIFVWFLGTSSQLRQKRRNWSLIEEIPLRKSWYKFLSWYLKTATSGMMGCWWLLLHQVSKRFGLLLLVSLQQRTVQLMQ